MELELSTQRTFVPEFNGNKKLPATEQITVIYRAPTPALKKKYLPKPDIQFKYDAIGNVKGGEVVVSTDDKAIVDGMLIRITGLTYRTEKGPRQAVSAHDLFEGPVEIDDLVVEIANFLREELQKKVDEKN